jgi:peptide chain release factor 1
MSRCYTDWRQVQEDIETAQMMLDDPEMREMAQEELRDEAKTRRDGAAAAGAAAAERSG